METKRGVVNQEQQDKAPKWLIWTRLLCAVGSCSAIFGNVIGLFGDAPGQCIKNWSYTRNYQKRLDADFKDMVRRCQFQQQMRNHGKLS